MDKEKVMDKMFSGVRAQWLPLYEEVKKQTKAALGDFEERETGNALFWRHSFVFAEIMVRKDCLVAAFPALVPHPEWEPLRITRISLHRAMHFFELRDAARIPWLVERFAESYSLTKSKKTGKNPILKRISTAEGWQDHASVGAATVDEYIAGFSPEVREKLSAIRQTIRGAAPEALEKISYQMPAFWQRGVLIYFAAFKDHLSIFPGAEAVTAFKHELEDYSTSKGTILVPYDKPVPYELIEKITLFRIDQGLRKKRRRKRA
ncbi:MAG: DUF5655 domain-containing protein [Spirochaetaceae bacterium]|jgi:uncharacterized protein YdhG (YjbR/CyaY superfamily)|nr:DUF5655 domain-containing protein [Spirochaetaceae bacterium]